MCRGLLLLPISVMVAHAFCPYKHLGGVMPTSHPPLEEVPTNHEEAASFLEVTEEATTEGSHDKELEQELKAMNQMRKDGTATGIRSANTKSMTAQKKNMCGEGKKNTRSSYDFIGNALGEALDINFLNEPYRHDQPDQPYQRGQRFAKDSKERDLSLYQVRLCAACRCPLCSNWDVLLAPRASLTFHTFCSLPLEFSRFTTCTIASFQSSRPTSGKSALRESCCLRQ